MLTIDVRTEFGAFARTLNDLQRNQLPYAAALGLNNTAKAVKHDMVEGMKSAFDRPSPFTLNSLYVERANKRHLEANVHFKDWAPKGVPAGKYLKAEILGQSRRAKASERRLGAALGLSKPFIVPTKHMDLDAYGNPNRGQLVTILARLGALGDASSGSRSRGRRREGYFAITPGGQQGRGGRGGGLPPGIYKVPTSGLGRAVIPVLTFAKKPPVYSQRFDFYGMAQASIAEYLRHWLPQAMEQALKTARPR